MISTDFETSRQVARRMRPERSRLLSARRALEAIQRRDFIRRVRAYLKDTREMAWAAPVVPRDHTVNWQALERERGFSRSVSYRQTYDRLSSAFLALGDAFIGQMLKLRPQI
jgi:hypothetical protein